MPAEGLLEKREQFVPGVVVLLSEEDKNQAAMILEPPGPNGAQPPSPDHRLVRPVESNESPRYVKLDQLDDFKSTSKQSGNANTKDRGIVHKAVQALEKVGSAVPERLEPPIPLAAQFIVRARTNFGDSVYLASSDNPDDQSIELRCERDGVWSCQARFDNPEGLTKIRFGIATNGSPVDWQHAPFSLPVPPRSSSRGSVIILEDADERTDDPLNSAAFSRVIFRRNQPASQLEATRARYATVKKAAKTGNIALVLGVRATRVHQDHSVYVVGNIAALGQGDSKKAVPLLDSDAPSWSVSISVPRSQLESGIEYRFIIKDEQGNVVADEDGARTLRVSSEMLAPQKSGTTQVVLGYVNSTFRYSRKWRGAGLAIPVFSIRSDTSCGVGEFNDLISIVDLCVATGHQLLQLLPVNDTTCFNTARDSYPYSAVSCFALHPQYINIDSLGQLLPDAIDEYEADKKRLNSLSEIDYVEVMRVKNKYIRLIYALQKHEFLCSPDFTEWFKEQQVWLVPYALYRFFTEINGTSEYDRWGDRSSLTPQQMEEFAAPDSFHFDYLGVVYFTQYHLHKQLSRASEYAAQNQVVFKGDLPIGVNRYCADTWLNPHLFHLNMQAGAPPDYFSQNGQNWGFPTYNWEAMKTDGYAWWRLRLGHMAKYFHAYRIDHILGFFRIWEIPSGFRTGMSGRFRPVIGIGRKELEMRGLWDIDRYTLPYVREGHLQEALGDCWSKVKDRFFYTAWEDRLKFKPEFSTEKQVDKALQLPANAPEHERAFNEKVSGVLTRLMNNVCLLRDVEDGDMFHPRYMVTSVNSFHELPSDDWKRALSELHDDYFFRRQEELWRASAMEKLPMMKKSSDMLVCGEDLGLVPGCVPSVMSATGILGLAVQRMPPGDLEFGNPSTHPYETVASTSSHDVSTLRGWWGELDEGAKQRFWEHIMGRYGKAPWECGGGFVADVLAEHMKSPAMLIITPLQDLLGMDESVRRPVATEEQINDPANPLHVWKFRLHMSTESMLGNKGLIAKMKTLTRQNGRGKPY